MDDRDGDVVRCRQPSEAMDECGGICEPIEGIRLDVVRHMIDDITYDVNESMTNKLSEVTVVMERR